MIVRKVFINTYKYDFQLAKICVASVRFWYPDIPIILIKDSGAGHFDTAELEQQWNLEIFKTSKKTFGWGYGKLEPLFLEGSDSFLVLDSDTVMTGPILDMVRDIDAQFIVDDEVQPEKRFNEIYYNLARINEIDPNFKYPGYSFNSGQWFGTSGVLSRKDFEETLLWTDPPRPRLPSIVFNGDQAHLNYMLHKKEQQGLATVARKKIMIWPREGNADFLELAKIRSRQPDYPFVIHWAGVQYRKLGDLPRRDIIFFYQAHYRKLAGESAMAHRFKVVRLHYEKKWKFFLRRMKAKVSFQ